MQSIVRIGLIVLIGFCGTRFAHAESPQVNQAEVYVKRGVALRRRGDDVAALREFQKAWEIIKTPRTSAQLGLCQQALGQWAPAQARLLDALGAKDDPWVSRNLAALEDALASAREHIGHLGIVGDPAGAEVLIGGRSVGSFPLGDPIAVSEGTVEVEVRAPNFQPASRSVKVAAGQFVDLVVRLSPQNAAAPPSLAPKFDSATAPRGDEGLVLHASDNPQEAEGKPIYRRPWFWVATGVVVAGAVIVGVLASGGRTSYPPAADKTGMGF